MRIIACCRSYNEHDNIEKFCNAFQFADKILVADGGSEDDTVALAERMPKVKVREFPLKVECANGIWRNPDGPHLQFLYDWALEEGADWTICQDCDQRPNKFLKEWARAIFEGLNKDFLQVTQIYLLGKDMYFPHLSKGGDEWQQGLWAWRSSINLKVIDKMPHFEFSLDGKTSVDVSRINRHHNLQPPYCFMHFGWETEEKVQKHIEYYRRSGLISGMTHPLEFGGKPEPLLDWMIE